VRTLNGRSGVERIKFQVAGADVATAYDEFDSFMGISCLRRAAKRFAGADNAAIFQLVHDACGVGVAEMQSPLQQRDASLVFAADDFDTLLDDYLLLLWAALVF